MLYLLGTLQRHHTTNNVLRIKFLTNIKNRLFKNQFLKFLNKIKRQFIIFLLTLETKTIIS